GPPIISVTVQAADVSEAARLAREQYDELVRQYAPSSNGHQLAAPSPVRALTAIRGRTLPAVRISAPRVDLVSWRSWLASHLDRDTLLIGLSATMLSMVAYWMLYWYGSQPVAWDARGYYDLALLITRVGMSSWADPMRTYAYPLFLAGFLSVMEDNPT